MSLKSVLSLLHYLIFSWHRNGHGVHSPYLFSLVTQAFRSARNKKVFATEERFRKLLLADKTSISVVDAGAGSNSLGSVRSVAQIARNSAVSPRYGRLLASIVQYAGAGRVLELGTSVGIGTRYLAKYAEHVTSVDACANTQRVASAQLEDCSNVELLSGRFDEVLPKLYAEEHAYDFVYVDGNHTKKGTLQNFDLIFPLIHSNSIVVFDDINWSEEMQEAWAEIKSDGRVTVCVDIWKMGIVLFRTEMTKDHLVVRY